MNKIGVVICNYNGEKYIISCLDVVFNSDIKEFDVYVVDNASTDNSVNLVIEKYGDKVNIIRNSQNFGGSGGFGRGIRECVKLGYEYITLIDNDAIVDINTISTLYKYMCEHSECGIAGAKIMMLDKPEYIMDYAARLDFKTRWEGSDWYNKKEDGSSQEIRECDFVAATTAMIRAEAVIKSGGMDERNFIYYDDIDMSYRIHLAGYKNISIGTCKSWHKSNLNNNVTNNFGTYYYTRNKWRFFAKYIDDSMVEEFESSIIENTFSLLYGSLKKGRLDLFHTNNNIFQDFINDIRGKAKDGVIIQYMTERNPKLRELLSGVHNIYIKECDFDCDKVIHKLQKYIDDNDLNIKIIVEWNNPHEIKEDECDISFLACKHVKDISENILPTIYIDEYLNLVSSQEDFYYFSSYKEQLFLFKQMYSDRLHNTICKIRAER
ncbi:MAG: glycosyltransferase family 2 protein [Lachnospira sp.]